MSKDLNKLAQAYAKEQLGPEQYDRNKDAVKAITTDFKAGYKAGQQAVVPAQRPAVRRPLQAGDQVRIVGEHPWQGTSGRLVSYQPYGLRFLNLEGWLVALDNGIECYAQSAELAPLPELTK